MQVDTDFILKDNFRQFRHQLLSIQGRFCFCSNEMQLCRIWRAKQKNHHFNNKCQHLFSSQNKKRVCQN